MSEFNFKQYLKEGRLFKEDLNYPQVDIEIQGKIYTIPVNLEDRERIFGDAEFELDDLLEDLGFNLDGVSSAALASDLTQKDFIDSYGNEDTKTFERVKSLGVQVDAIRGLLDGKINSTIQNNQLKENITYKEIPIENGDKFQDDEGDIFTVTKTTSDKIELKDEDGIPTTFPDDFDDGDFDYWFTKENTNER